VNSVTGVTFGGVVSESICKGLMEEYLINHFNEIDHIFSIVNIDNELSSDYRWIAPAYCSYTIFSQISNPKPFIAILSLVGDKSVARSKLPRLSQEVSPGLIPTGCNSGFAVSSSLFIQNFIVPAVNAKMDDSANAQFTYDSDYDALINKQKFNLPGATYGGITYTPYCEIGDFSMEIKNGKLHFKASYTCPISPGIRGKGYVEQYYTLQLGSNKDSFDLVEDTTMKKEEHHADVDSGVTIAEVVISIVVGIVGAIVGYMTKAANIIVKRILTLVITAVLETIVQIPQFIMQHGMDALGKFELSFQFLAIGVRTISWTGIDAFNPTKASFENCFLIGGDPVLK